MDPIESHKNPYFKVWKTLLEGRGLKKHAQFLLMGRKLVPEMLKQRPELFSTLIHSPDHIDHGLQLPPQVIEHPLSRLLFGELDIFQTRFPMLVGNIPKMKSWDPSKASDDLEVLTALGDPANQGALLRSCEAFGIKKVVLLKESSNPFHPKAIRASSGSVLRLNMEVGPSIQELPDSVISLDMHGTGLPQFEWPKQGRLLMGEEGQGLPDHLRGNCISIPMSPKIESLNAVAATSIALYSYRVQHPLVGV